MKKQSLCIAVLAFAALAAGCKKTEPASEPLSAGDTNSGSLSVTQQLQSAKEMATNAWQKTKQAATNLFETAKESVQSTADFAYDRKDEFVAKAGTYVDSIDQKIKELSDRAVNASDSVKADLQTKIQALKDQRAVLNQKLDSLKDATEANWQEMKAGFLKAYDDTKAACKEAWDWLTDKLKS